MRYERLEQIRNILKKTKSVSLNQLCNDFKVSKNTIRRDVDELEKKGEIVKFYGGIRLPDISSEPLPIDDRMIAHAEAKRIVAKKAAEQVRSGDIVYIDSGSTTVYMPQFLKDTQDITIISNSFRVIEEAVHYRLNLIVLGGMLYLPSESFIITDASDVLRRYNITKAFMASSGVSFHNGATNASPLETSIKQAVMRENTIRYLLIDSSKFGRNALMTYSNLTDFQYVISEVDPPAEYAEYFRKHKITVI
ncbi:MAG: DeoR/GlpR family DNA-binding transcription regulator [Succinatimonas hippei]|nr:DeoR/GlpR family DNA-binding transcription regulator [Succinatimonas hippei]